VHIPDGFIDGKTAAATAALSAVGVGLALRQVRRELPPRKIPLLGLAAAFLFAAQMVNFPVAGGTSGHLLGGVLVAALLGPSAAVVVMTTVLIVQCFLFADGGVLALGANIFNMAILGSMSGYAIYRLVGNYLPGIRGRVTAVAFASWCSVVLASIACAGQLAWSGTVAWSVAFPAMTGVHMLIGLGEGAISALVFYAVAKARPELTTNAPAQPARSFVGYGLLVAIGIALFVAPFACPWPDGLEAVAAKLGFEHVAKESMAAPMTNYVMPGVGSVGVATALAGIVGSLVAFVLAVVLSFLIVRKEPTATKTSASA